MRQPLVLFIALVLALELLVVLARPDSTLMPFALVLVPAAAATTIAAATGGRSAIRALLARIVRWRVAPRWYAWAFGIPLLGTLMIDLGGWIAGETDPARLIAAVTPAALAVPLVVLLPAFLEEYGWRGFGVQAAVDAGWSGAVAALIVGAVFVAIHLPLYLPGQIYADVALWPAVSFLLGFSAFATWLYLGTGGSAFLVALAHATSNGATPLTWGLDAEWAWGARGVIFGLLGVAFLAALLRTRREPHSQDRGVAEPEVPEFASR